MKTIEVTDKDYDILMELSKELQTQTNNGQAFPYFWEPASSKLSTNIHGEGAVLEVYYDTETYSLEDFAEYHEDFYEKFLVYSNEYVEEEDQYEYKEYHEEIEDEWEDYIKDYIEDADIWTSDWKQDTEHNPSLFLSDVDRKSVV